jgi:hypothetical protein
MNNLPKGWIKSLSIPDNHKVWDVLFVEWLKEQMGETISIPKTKEQFLQLLKETE